LFIIKHSVQNRSDEVIRDGLLPLGGATYDECSPLMEQQAKTFDHHGYEGQHDRWWGWDESTREEVHYWWTVPVGGSDQ